MARTGSQISRVVVCLVLAGGGCNASFAQTNVSASLPEAPKASLLAQSNVTQTPSGPPSQAPAPEAPAPGEHPRLTRTDAEQMAIKNNHRVINCWDDCSPLVSSDHVVRREQERQEVRDVYFLRNVTAEDAEQASRISAGTLT